MQDELLSPPPLKNQRKVAFLSAQIAKFSPAARLKMAVFLGSGAARPKSATLAVTIIPVSPGRGVGTPRTHTFTK